MKKNCPPKDYILYRSEKNKYFYWKISETGNKYRVYCNPDPEAKATAQDWMTQRSPRRTEKLTLEEGPETYYLYPRPPGVVLGTPHIPRDIIGLIEEYVRAYRLDLTQPWRLLDSFGGYGTGNGEFIDPQGITTTPERNIVVVDTYNNRVQILDPIGNFLFAFGRPGNNPGEFNSPQDIAVDSLGNILVADTNNNRIQVFDPKGNFIQEFGRQGNRDGEFFHPNGIAIHPNGNIIVADSGNNRIQVFNSRGHYMSKFGQRGEEAGKLYFPTSVAISPNGDIVIVDGSNDQVQVFQGPSAKNKLGEFLYAFAQGDFARRRGRILISHPKAARAIAIDSHGYMVVTYPGKIKVFDPRGNHIYDFDDESMNPYGITIDLNGNILVTDRANDQIHVIGV